MTMENYPEDAWELLKDRLTPQRLAKMESVAQNRTRHIRLVLQDVHDPHNISACLRSAEALGVLHIDIVNERSQFKTTSVAKGASNWLIINRWDNISHCGAALKRLGYKIAGAYPNANGLSLFEVPVEQPVAILFGNEHEGIGKRWHDYIDYNFTIPMVGMVESFNISVSAALSMMELTQRGQRAVEAGHYYLSNQEQNQLLSRWVCKTSRNFKAILQHKRKSLAINKGL